MDFKQESNRIYLENEAGKTVAEVTFPSLKEGIVNINHTYVDDSLRGQGIAGKLMEEVAHKLQQDNMKAVLTCSYAVKWFEKSEKYKDLISRDESR